MTHDRRTLRVRLLPAALTLAGTSLFAVGCAVEEPQQSAPATVVASHDAPGDTAPRADSSPDLGLAALGRYHRYRDGVAWRIGPDGVEVETGPPPADEKKRAEIIDRVWRDYGTLIVDASARHGVPAELLVAIIVEESSGRPQVFLREPGYVSDAKTPHKLTVGLTGVLLSTARSVMDNPRIDRHWLYNPANAIEVSARYVAMQYPITGYDVPKVAAAYNAGKIYYDGSEGNRWKMLTYPKGSSEFIDNFVTSFNMATAYLADGRAPAQSFAAAMGGD
ncbi:MAG TPA: transglycosylase SLT domain-containing protein [Alphaproteobacteria bacterium]